MAGLDPAIQGPRLRRFERGALDGRVKPGHDVKGMMPSNEWTKPMPITALYAAILAALFLGLSACTITTRRAAKVEIGHGEDRALLRRMRVHANFAEYAPFALLLVGLAESLSAWPLALHATGLLLVAGRFIHAYGLSQEPHILRLRVLGMALTFTAIGAGAAMCAVLAAGRLF